MLPLWARPCLNATKTENSTSANKWSAIPVCATLTCPGIFARLPVKESAVNNFQAVEQELFSGDLANLRLQGFVV